MSPKLRELCAVLLLLCCGSTGQVALSPSDIASVCHGEQLNFVCTSQGGFIEWGFFANDGLSDRRYTRILSTISQMSQLMINRTVFTFSRISGENSLPLTSRLSISPIGGGLNGTLVNCTDLATFNTSSTIINVINDSEDQIHDQGINTLLEQFESNVVTVIVEWNVEESSARHYDVFIRPPATFMYKQNTIVQLRISYNIAYNVSIESTSMMCRRNMTAVTELYYTNCISPQSLHIDDSVSVLGYRNPALQGSTIWFTCPSGMTLTGSNSSICMGNGYWVPDPREVECEELLLNGVRKTQDIKIAVLSSVMVFIVSSIFFFITGCLCHHFIGHKRNTVTVAESSADATATLQRDIVINSIPQQNLELELTANVAYTPVRL